MSNLGFNGIYGFLNKRNDVVCERAFLPSDDDIQEHIRTKTPIFSLESKTPIERFQIIAFSLSFENDYPNILKILNISNIPFSSSERNKYHPLLIAGGACMFFNPEPVANIFDIIFIGEVEESLNEFIDSISNSVTNEVNNSILIQDDIKKRIKKTALDIKGVYVPDFYEIKYAQNGLIAERISRDNAPASVLKRYIKDIDQSQFSHTIVTSETEFSDMSLVEIMRGCPWNCRFCVVGHAFNPPRRKSIHIVREEIEKSLKLSDRVGLIGPSLSDYPQIEDITNINDVHFSITSLRATTKSAAIINTIKNHKSISIAPEAATERLRNVINKKVTETDILETAELMLNSGIEHLRLYFMIGLPTEDADDIAAIIKLAERIRSLSNKGTVVLSISTFVPKPFTPFQWHHMEPLESLKHKLQFIKKSLSNIKNLKVFHDLPKYAYLQGLLAIGDRRITEVLKMMLIINNWQKAALMADINIDFYLFRKKDYDELLPWDFIDHGISKKALWDEYMKAISE